MIPKIIHYCWFGESELALSQKKLINEWKFLNPDYKLIKWDETNIPLDIDYTKNAQNEKKWANLSNFTRLYALIKFGGIYIDTDFKIIKNLDPLLPNKCFLGFETKVDEKSFIVNNAFIGAIPNHQFIIECYNGLLSQFDGTEKANESSPLLTTEILKKNYSIESSETINLGEIRLYNYKHFYPIHWSETFKLKEIKSYIYPETYAVHFWSKSWVSNEMLIDEINTWQKWADDLKKRNNELIQEIQEKDLTVSTIHYLEEGIKALVEQIKIQSSSLSKQNTELIEKVEELHKSLIDSHTTFNKNIESLEKKTDILQKNNFLLKEENILEFNKLKNNQDILFNKLQNTTSEKQKENNDLLLTNVTSCLKEFSELIIEKIYLLERKVTEISNHSQSSLYENLERTLKEELLNYVKSHKETHQLSLKFTEELNSDIKKIYKMKEMEISLLRADLNFQTKATSIMSNEIEKTNETLALLKKQFENENTVLNEHITELKIELAKKNQQLDLLSKKGNPISNKLKQLLNKKG